MYYNMYSCMNTNCWFVILGNTSKHKKLILYDKTFFIDIVDKTICSKVEKLINTYGGVSF